MVKHCIFTRMEFNSKRLYGVCLTEPTSHVYISYPVPCICDQWNRPIKNLHVHVTHDHAASCGLTVVHFIYQKYQGWPQEPTSSQLEQNMAIYHSIVQPQSLNTIILLILVSYATSPDPSGCHN